jgi:hypothetical protein
MNTSTQLLEIRTAMTVSGFFPENLEADGKIKRFKRTSQDENLSCWYVIYVHSSRNNELYYVAVWGDWRTSEKHQFNSCRPALSSGEAHISDVKTGGAPRFPERFGYTPKGTVIRDTDSGPEPEYWIPCGYRIGWIDGEKVYLDPGASYTCAQNIARKQNDCLPVTQHTLWKRLDERGHLLKSEKGRNTTKRVIMGTRRRVLELATIDFLYDCQNRGIQGDQDAIASIQDKSPSKIPLFNDKSTNGDIVPGLFSEPVKGPTLEPQTPHKSNIQ